MIIEEKDSLLFYELKGKYNSDSFEDLSVTYLSSYGFGEGFGSGRGNIKGNGYGFGGGNGSGCENGDGDSFKNVHEINTRFTI